VSSRSSLKWGLLACLIILAATAIFQGEWTYPLWVKESLYFIEAGSAVSAVAICLALIATV
jgi:hypothetical protein